MMKAEFLPSDIALWVSNRKFLETDIQISGMDLVPFDWSAKTVGTYLAFQNLQPKPEERNHKKANILVRGIAGPIWKYGTLISLNIARRLSSCYEHERSLFLPSSPGACKVCSEPQFLLLSTQPASDLQCQNLKPKLTMMEFWCGGHA